MITATNRLSIWKDDKIIWNWYHLKSTVVILTKKEHRKINDTKYAYANCEPQSFFNGELHSECRHESMILFQASPVAHLFQFKIPNENRTNLITRTLKHYRKSSIKPEKNVRKLLCRLISVSESNFILPNTWKKHKIFINRSLFFSKTELFSCLHSDNGINEKKHRDQ